MGLCLPPTDLFDEGKLLGPLEHEIVGKYLESARPPLAQVNEMFVATEKQFSDQPRISQLRDQIISDYTGSVFCDKLPSNPPNRGRYGVAFIPLKENAQPTWSRPFPMQGEKEIAYKKIVQDWIDQDLVERPKGKPGNEWCSPGFAVPKKSTTFPWRGVVDVRGPNSQSRKCNYPLPIIEEVLVRRGGSYLLEN